MSLKVGDTFEVVRVIGEGLYPKGALKVGADTIKTTTDNPIFTICYIVGNGRKKGELPLPIELTRKIGRLIITKVK